MYLNDILDDTVCDIDLLSMSHMTMLVVKFQFLDDISLANSHISGMNMYHSLNYYRFTHNSSQRRMNSYK